MRDKLLKALRLHFEAHVEKHKINVENLLEHPQGVADHPDIMETIENEMLEIEKYHSLLDVLNTYFGGLNTTKELIQETFKSEPE